MSPTGFTPLTDTFGIAINLAAGDPLPAPETLMSAVVDTGAVLLRGFPLDTDTFVEFSGRCCGSFSKYVGGGIRFRALDREDLGADGTLMSTTGNTQSFSIPLHGEMYYQKNRPDIVWFYCRRAPDRGGQTTLADGVEMFARLTEESKRLLRTKQLRYIRQLEREDWITSFMTDKLEELRDICAENEMMLETGTDGAVTIEYVAPAIVARPNEPEIFINSAIILWEFERALRDGSAAGVLGPNAPTTPPLVVRFEDGTELPESLMREIAAIAKHITFEVQWQNYDVVIVDNRRILHGRRKAPAEGREILVRLGHLARAEASA